jgi:hypothetical protein
MQLSMPAVTKYPSGTTGRSWHQRQALHAFAVAKYVDREAENPYWILDSVETNTAWQSDFSRSSAIVALVIAARSC